MSIDELRVARIVRGPFTDPCKCSDEADAYWSLEAVPGEEVMVVHDKHPLLSMVAVQN